MMNQSIDDSLDEELSWRRQSNAEKWEELKAFLWDPKKQEYLGRQLIDWGKVVAYYTVFYFCVITLFTICLSFYTLVLDEITPTQTSKESPLQDLPGLSFRPVSDFETTLVRFIQGQPSTYKPHTDHIQSFLDQYENSRQVGEHFIDCTLGRPPNSDNKVCRFELNKLGNCTWQRDYGYDEGQPCILLKLNRIIGWRPQTYENNDANITGMPPINAEYIGVSCEGRYPQDLENIGDISYDPPGFSKHFFPYLNQEGYRSPLVMVQFRNPINGVLINVVCRAWAKNIKQHLIDGLGVVTFSLLVD